jgi:uncharacterized protein YjiS (DUF1127 family)
MTALDHHTHAIAAGRRTVAAVSRVSNGLRALLRSLLNRREVNRLGSLSDHELADIGLMRTDLVVAMRAPVGVDPTARLSAIVRERYLIEDGARRTC